MMRMYAINKYVKKDNSVVVVYYRIKGDPNKNYNMD